MLSKLYARQRKRIAYLEENKMRTSNDYIMEQLDRAIRQERIKAMRKTKRQYQLSLDLGI